VRPLAHDRLGALQAVGRLAAEVQEILVAQSEPAAAAAGTLLLCDEVRLGPGIALGDAALAHPDGLLAHILHALSAREMPLAFGREKLRKLTVTVPETHLAAARDAITQAGAGHIGNYRDCTFTSHGEGTFQPLAGAHPFLGQPGSTEHVAEARIEAVYPPYREAAILASLRAAHPYEEIAYDILRLGNPDPTYGLGRLGLVEGEHVDVILQKVLAASGANALYVCDGTPARMVRRVLLGGSSDLLAAAEATAPDLVIWDTVQAAAAERLHRQGVHVAELRDLPLCGVRHLTQRLREVLPVPVRDASEGLMWRSYRNEASIGRS
jgi:hypothetical protein